MRVVDKVYAYSRIPELPLIIACSQSFFRAAIIACSQPRAVRAAIFQSCQEMRRSAGSAESAQELVYTQ